MACKGFPSDLKNNNNTPQINPNHSWVTLSAYLCFPAYVLPVKLEMEMMIQQYEKAKVIQDEQLERLTQICQEQGVKFSYVFIYA